MRRQTIRQQEINRADRAMARVFKRIGKCQEVREDAGCCAACLLAAVWDWKRFTRKK